MSSSAPPATAPLLADFLTYEQAVAGIATATRRHRSLYLRTFLRWWAATHPDRDVTTASTTDLTAFLVAEAERGMAAMTRRGQVSALRRFYGWLVLTGRADHDPTVLLQAPRARPVPVQPYRPEEITTILAHTAGLATLRGRLRHLVVATLRYTGMRQGELRTLRLADLDLAGGRATVTGKGGRRRPVLLSGPLVPLLQDYLTDIRPQLPDSPLLLVNPHPAVTTAHHGFGPEAVYREVELAGQRAGVPGRHFPHRWRHTYATELVRAGVDIHLVQRLLGHRSITSTAHYAHLDVDDLRGVIDRLWPPHDHR